MVEITEQDFDERMQLMDQLYAAADAENYDEVKRLNGAILWNADTLDDLKAIRGIAHVLEWNYNTTRAVEVYGDSWLQH